MAETTDAILMASGFSRRFGARNKLLYPVLGRPLAAHTLALVTRFGGFSNIWFVTAEPEVSRLGQGLPVTPLHNPDPSVGSGGSVRLGVAASSANYYMFFPCDQPLLDETVLQSLLDRKKPGVIVQPQAEGAPASPTLFSAAFREQLLHLPPGQQAKSIWQAHPEWCVRVPIADARLLVDIDRPEDVQRIESMTFDSSVN